MKSGKEDSKELKKEGGRRESGRKEEREGGIQGRKEGMQHTDFLDKIITENIPFVNNILSKC